MSVMRFTLTAATEEPLLLVNDHAVELVPLHVECTQIQARRTAVEHHEGMLVGDHPGGVVGVVGARLRIGLGDIVVRAKKEIPVKSNALEPGPIVLR
jgi:hypothetical protein